MQDVCDKAGSAGNCGFADGDQRTEMGSEVFGMTYLVMDGLGHRIVTAESLRREIDNGSGRMRIFRLCDLKDPKELYLRWFGNVWTLTDMYGNVEQGV